jgi:hypothetical protein
MGRGAGTLQQQPPQLEGRLVYPSALNLFHYALISGKRDLQRLADESATGRGERPFAL